MTRRGEGTSPRREWATHRACRDRAAAAPQAGRLRGSDASVVATFDDGQRKELFDFYPDEITFGEGELVGLTTAVPLLQGEVIIASVVLR